VNVTHLVPPLGPPYLCCKCACRACGSFPAGSRPARSLGGTGLSVNAMLTPSRLQALHDGQRDVCDDRVALDMVGGRFIDHPPVHVPNAIGSHDHAQLRKVRPRYA
jgi:hypothetical protein